jgi:hypothetical protein
VYDYWLPKTGAKLPAISIIEVGTVMQKEAGLGEQLTATEKGVYISVVLQLDVWALTAATVREVADKARYCLWINRDKFGDKGPLGIQVSGGVFRAEEGGVYRQQFTVEAVYAMTKLLQ